MSFELFNFAQNLYLRMKIDWTKTGVAFFLISLAAFSRLIPHPGNFTAIGALSIYSALIIPNRTLAALFPLLAMWISDLVINNILYSSYYPSFMLFSEGAIWVYLGLFSHSLTTWLFSNRKTIITVSGASVVGAVAFFFLSNFGVWVGTDMYPHTPSGLGACYVAALPFFGNFLAGNLFFSFVLLWFHSILEKGARRFHLTA